MSSQIEGSKNYTIAIDVLEEAGIEALKHLCEKGNRVHIDIKEIRRRAKDEKNKYRYNLDDLLEYITANKLNNNSYSMPQGGELILDPFEEKDKEIVITKDQCLRSILSTDGKIEDQDFQYPKFLQYGPETMEKGVLEIDFIGDPNKITLDDILNQLSGAPVCNNQIIKVNGGSAIYSVKQRLNSNNRKDRFTVDESQMPELLKIDLTKIYSPLEGRGIKVESIEQKLALKNLLNPEIELCVIGGGSGSGKTLLPYMAAVQSILGTSEGKKDAVQYDGIVLIKSPQLIGKDVMGFLPGDEFAKAERFMKSYMDAHRDLGIPLNFKEMLKAPQFDQGLGVRSGKIKIDNQYLPSRNPAIEYGIIQDMLGRTFKRKYIIIDESQNIEPYHMKQLLERAGEGSKVVVVGDPINQIHNRLLSKNFNGLVWAANANFGSNPLCSINMLYENRRSQLAAHTREAFATRLL